MGLRTPRHCIRRRGEGTENGIEEGDALKGTSKIKKKKKGMGRRGRMKLTFLSPSARPPGTEHDQDSTTRRKGQSLAEAEP
jgi:hypothetical protein